MVVFKNLRSISCRTPLGGTAACFGRYFRHSSSFKILRTFSGARRFRSLLVCSKADKPKDWRKITLENAHDPFMLTDPKNLRRKVAENPIFFLDKI
jgi:hypothetical protein